MQLEADEINEIVSRHIAPFSIAVGDEVFQYIVASLVSVISEKNTRVGLEDDLIDFLWPYMEESGATDYRCIVDSIIGDVFKNFTDTCATHAPSSHDELICCIENLTLMYGGSADRLLNNTTLRLCRGRCYGMVGRNGKGKTTLMSKIATGQLMLAEQLKCTYIQYEGILDGIDSTISCREYVEIRCAGPEVSLYLQQMGFSDSASLKSVQQLSGGWRMRLALAGAISENPDLYLLDEPTNHLDSSGQACLEEYLTRDGRQKTAIVVSHDYAFLKKVCTDVIHFTPKGKLEYHAGDVDVFLDQTKHESELEESSHALSSREVGLAQRFAFPNPGRDGLGHVVATLTACNFRYAEHQELILKDIMLQLTMKCRVGVIGPNGAGKSTLLNLLAQELLPLSEGEDVGAIWHDPSLRVAYVAQQHFHHLSDYLDITPVEYIQNRFASGWDEELRKRLVLPRTLEAIEYRANIAATHGGKPFYRDATSDTWKGREVEAVLERRVTSGELQYLIQWKVEAEEMEAGVVADHTWEPAQKLRFMGVEMLCVAFDSRTSYARKFKRSLHAADVSRHLSSVGINDYMVHQPIKSFSAGQMSKLVLAATVWHKPHILLLDEPTNFLDIETVDALSEAIKRFQGGVVVVSHNAGFLKETCSHIWQIEEGHLKITDLDGASKAELIKEKLLAQAARDKEKQGKTLKQQLQTFECKPEDVGHVICKAKVLRSFQHFIGSNLPKDALQCAVETFVSVAEERRPSTSHEWLPVVVAATNMLEMMGFEEFGVIAQMGAILVALLRHLIQICAIGSIDSGKDMQVAHLANTLISLQFREKAALYEQCCFCGQSLDHGQVEKHEKVCLMSPMRCGRHLEGMNFEMFHGTSAANASAIEREGFRPSSGGMLGRGVYCSRDLRKARRYGQVVLRLSVSLGRVITIDRQGHPLQKIWQTEIGGSFDAAWVPPNCGVVPSGMEENCVRSPSQIVLLGRVKLDGGHLF